MPTPKLTHCLVFVSDLEKVANFYRDVFAMKEEPSSSPDYVLMNGDVGDIAIHSVPPQFREEVSKPPQRREDGTYKVCFSTDNLDALREAILKSGGTADDPWEWEGTTYCECTDPEGNPIQIYCPT